MEKRLFYKVRSQHCATVLLLGTGSEKNAAKLVALISVVVIVIHLWKLGSFWVSLPGHVDYDCLGKTPMTHVGWKRAMNNTPSISSEELTVLCRQNVLKADDDGTEGGVCKTDDRGGA